MASVPAPCWTKTVSVISSSSRSGSSPEEAAGWRPGEPYEAYAQRAAELLPQVLEDLRRAADGERPALPAGNRSAAKEE